MYNINKINCEMKPLLYRQSIILIKKIIDYKEIIMMNFIKINSSQLSNKKKIFLDPQSN